MKQKTRKEISKLFLQNPLEDVSLLDQIDKILKKKRGKEVITLPSENTPVIVLQSGGLDTTILCEYLMDVYKLKIYPLFLKRGQKRTNEEEKSIDAFTYYFLKKYPGFYSPPFKMHSPIPPYEIRWPITRVSNDKEPEKGKQKQGIPVFTSLMGDYALQYAYYLYIREKILIRDIFCGVMPLDGRYFPYETLTGIRGANLSMCIQTKDYNWQYIPLFIERELGFYHEKAETIQWAQSKNIPLELTWSCFHKGIYHCGNCMGCRARIKAFLQARVPDKTRYFSDTIYFKFSSKIDYVKRKIQSIL